MMMCDDIPPELIIRIENEWRYYDNELRMPFPWYTRPCLEWLLSIDMRFTRTWEYGMVDSTQWYIKKGAIVKGVDNNPYYNKHNGMVEETKYRYVTAIETSGMHDIVVIDGVFRDDCTQYALEFLKPGGYLIIDNYKQPSADLKEWPLTEKLIEGMEIMEFKEPGHQDWQTIVVKKK